MTALLERRHGRCLDVALQPKTITAFDLCAGVGGFRAGSEAISGLKIKFVGSCEIDPYSNRTYKAMFRSEEELQINDLRSVTRFPNEQDLIRLPYRQERLRKIRDLLPSFSLLTAGFPCQSHSLMGNRLGEDDERGSLFYDIAEVIRAAEPRHFILENVRAIKSVNAGSFYEGILATLQTELGYTVRVWELNAADYGVPQTRRRIFFVGSKGRLPDVSPPTVPRSNAQYATVWHLLEKKVDEKYYLTERILKTVLKDEHKGYRRKADINQIIARPLTRTMHKMHRASQDNYYSDAFVHGNFNEDTGTVTLAKTGQDRIRRITPREAFRIQSFSNTLTERAVASGVSDTQLYMQAGNAVPPRLVQSVIEHTLGELNG